MKKDTLALRPLVGANLGRIARQSLRAAALLPVLGIGTLWAEEVSSEIVPAPVEKKIPAAEKSGQKLEPVVVIASRAPERLSEVTPSASYIDKADLIPAGKYSLSEVLREEQGVYVASYGATGAASSMFARGADSRMTQVTLDGRRLNAGLSNFDTSTLLMDNLSSVQLMRGASSTLYGANAMGGVIGLYSVDPFTTERAGGTLSVEHGSYGFWRTGFEVAGTGAQLGVPGSEDGTGWGFSIGGSYTDTDNKRGNNDYRMVNILPRVDYKVSDQLRFDVLTRYYDYSMGLPGDNTVPDGYDALSKQSGYNWLVSPGVTMDLTESVQLRAFYSYTKNNLFTSSRYWDSWSSIWSPLEDAASNVDKHEVSLLATWQVTDELNVTGGYTFEKSLIETKSYTYGSEYSARRDSNSPWVQVRYEPVEDLKISGGVRYNQFSSFDDAWTGEANVSYRIAPTDTTVHVRVASAYATPDESTLAYGYSSQGLEPESNVTWEVGARQELDVLEGGRLSIVYFENHFRDMISWVPASGGIPAHGENIDKVTTRGVEMTAEINPIEDVRLYANATYLRTKNKQTGARLVRRPDWTFTVGAEVNPWEALTLGISATYVHGVEDTDAATWARVKNENYTYGRAYATLRLSENAEIFGRVENLFDEDYWTANGYPALPINAYGGFRVTF